MKHLMILVVASITLLTACDPELNYFYSIENLTTSDLEVSALVQFADDSTLVVTVIPPNETREVESYHFIGTTKTIDTDPIYLETLLINNMDGLTYNKDQFDSSRWEKEKDGRNDGFFLLKVDEEDF